MKLLIVFNSSRRTQHCLMLGVLLFIGINILGDLMLGNFYLEGYFEPISDVIREKLFKRYDKLALITLISFFGLAIKAFYKDWKELNY